MNIDQLLKQLSEYNYEFNPIELVQQHIFDLSTQFGDNHNAIIDIKQFVIFFINHTSEIQIDGLILVSKLIELYQQIVAQSNVKQLQLKNISDYIISSSEMYSDFYNAKFLPQKQKKHQNQRLLSEAELCPPEILGLDPCMLKRLKPQLRIENIHSNNQIIQALQGDGELFLILQFCETVHLLEEFCYKRILKPKYLIDGNFVIYGYYSKQQQRLGVILRNNNIIFWDKRDNYNYDFTIETQLEIIKLTYLELQDIWLTSTHNGLQIWNLETAKCSTLQNQVLSQGQITIIMEAMYLQMVLVGQQPNIISCWDMFEQKFLFKFTVAHQILYQMICCPQFQLLFTIGFNNYICCYELHAQYNDYNLKCQFKGHNTTVQCIEHIQGTSLLLSIDNKNIVILWDIRSQQQIQIINLTTRMLTKQFFLYQNRMCLVTNILSTLSFEQSIYPKKHITLQQIIYDQWNQRNIIITRADIRVQNIITGKTQYVLSDFKNEISAACLIEHGHSIIIGTTEGDLLQISLKHGNVINEWEELFQEEIHKITFDEQAQLLHIISIYSTLKCLSLYPLNVRKDNIIAKDKRALRQLLMNNPINLCYISPLHGIMIVCFEDFIQIWNLEYYYIAIQIQLEDNAIVTSVTLCDKLPLLIVGTNQADIFIFQIIQKHEKLVCTLEGHLNIVKSILIQKLKHIYNDRIQIMSNLFAKTSQELTELYDDADEQFEVKHLYNNKYKLMTTGSFASSLLLEYSTQLRLFVATNRGSILSFDLTGILDKKSIIKKLESVTQRNNYNPYRVIYDTLQTNFIENFQIVQNRLIKDSIKRRESKFEQSNKIKQKFRNSLIRFSILKGLKDNPELDVTHSLTDQIFSFDEYLEIAEQVHKDMIIQITLLKTDPYEMLFQKNTELILFASLDDTIKIFSMDYQLQCEFSIHDPIPQKWTSLVNYENKRKAYLLISLDLIKEILPSLSKEKQENYDIDNIMRQVSMKFITQKQSISTSQQQKEIEKPISKLKDSYLNKKKQSLQNIISTPIIPQKLPPSLRYYDEKIKQLKYQKELQYQEKLNEQNSLKRQQLILQEQHRNQKKEIIDFLTPEIIQTPKYYQEEFSTQLQLLRLRTDPRTHQSKITKITNDTKRTFTGQSMDFFDYAESKDFSSTRSKFGENSRIQTRRDHQVFHKIISQLHGRLKISKRQA